MIKRFAHAKLNLNLHILPDLKFKKDTGYYPIHFINCELDLHDDLYLENQDEKIEFTCDNGDLSNDENLVYKIAILLKKESGNPKLGVKIRLHKRIPVKAGLGGGSSDAAAALNALLKLWKIRVTPLQMTNIINALGSDIFYFVHGGLCEVTGRGEIIKELLSQLPKMWLILITPSILKPSTAWMYKNINTSTIGLSLDKLNTLKDGIVHKKKKDIINSVHNDFEKIIAELYPTLENIKKDLKSSGSLHELIAGSGLTIVGFYLTKQSAEKAFINLQIKYKNIIWTHTK